MSLLNLTARHAIDQVATENTTAGDMASRSMIEKKSIINLLEAYAISLKHYLRGEDGIYYECAECLSLIIGSLNLLSRDLYYLVKFLPAYAMPAGIPYMADLASPGEKLPVESPKRPSLPNGQGSLLYQRNYAASAPSLLPLPVTSSSPRKATFQDSDGPEPRPSSSKPRGNIILPVSEEGQLFPSRMPPKYHLFDLFPFSLLVKWLTKRGRSVKGKKAAKFRAQMRKNAISHNLPLELSLYLVCT
ncbi:hypothetical protein DXG03_002013 [Asterophora parasitica]|uniref:Uncharacterized protein n=1 Tax=Asterophora parasitica TaxID=117018 RepID=A0A9P7KA16_9AGAR|nr:hypothetical protein DXG03_002013 [Asterophora parasitica]